MSDKIIWLGANGQHKGRTLLLAQMAREALAEGRRVAMFDNGEFVRVLAVAPPAPQPEPPHER